MNNTTNHINHTKLEFSCGAGSANVNVYTGRLLFERPDLNVGVNSYAVGVSHIFDSQPSEHVNAHVGNGWKLNIQQYLLQGEESGTYLYIDGYGYTHLFEQYEATNATTKKYFDRSGSGLVLQVIDSEYTIEDAQGGKMIFGAVYNGIRVLTRTVSAVNSSIEQIIEYTEDGRLYATYDGRKRDRAIKFIYDETSGNLSRMECKANETALRYCYDGEGNLVQIKECSLTQSRYGAAFSYAGKLLRYAVNVEDNSCLKFTYDNGGRATNVSRGVMKVNGSYGEARPALYVTDSVYCGANKYCGQQERKFSGYSVSGADDDFEQDEICSTISYASNQTSVKNSKGIEHVYFFNAKGFTVGILEKINGKYRTLFKQTGVCAYNEGSGVSINGKGCVTCTGTYAIPAQKKEGINNYLKKDINTNNYDYLLSFWAKLNSEQTTNVKAYVIVNEQIIETDSTALNIPLGSRAHEESRFSKSILLDNTARGVWQYVTVPFSYIKYADKITNIQSSGTDSIKTKEDRDIKEVSSLNFSGLTGSISIADVRVSAGQAPKFMLTNGLATSTDSGCLLNDITSIEYTLTTGVTGGGDVSNSFFMTESDVVQTYFEKFKAGSGSYTLICNAGTKRIGKVTAVKWKTANAEYALGIDTDGSAKIPRYFYVNEPTVVPWSKTSWVYCYTAYVTETIGAKHIKCVCQKTKAYLLSNVFGENKEAISYEYSYTDYCGRTVKETDAYNVTTEYIYDECGNLVKTIISGQDTDETIVSEWIYDGDKETLLATKDGVSGGEINATVETDPLFGTLKRVEQAGAGNLSSNVREYGYNAFNDKLREAVIRVNGVEYGKNTLTFDSNGRIKELSPHSSYKYQIGYDKFGNVQSYGLNGVTMLTKEYDLANNSITVNYHRSASQTDKIKSTYDHYGRLTGVTNSGFNGLSMVYQNIVESPSCANIQTLTDNYTGEVTTYNYDEDTGKPKGYTITSGGAQVLTVDCTGNNKIEYDFDGWKLDFEDEIKYDEDCLLSPRVKSISNNSGFGMSWSFSYDQLGRCISRSSNDNAQITPTTTIQYKRGTTLKAQLRYEDKSNSNYYETLEQNYDIHGNVLSIKDEIKYPQSGVHNFDGVYINTYEYNALNQLVKEINGGYGITRNYRYNSEGNLASTTENGVTETYNYSLGRLMNVTKNGSIVERYTYDNCGNPLCFKSGAQNMWWERGTLLKQYVKNGSTLSYTYDGQGRLYKKQTPEKTHRCYYDGDKLIAMEIGDKILRFFYDIEGIAGFKVGTTDCYSYNRDAQGNVVSLVRGHTMIARYIYDAWGKCKVVDYKGEEITAWDNAAVLNPIRWKSQFYDADSGLYWIGNRWYDPERGRYISAASPEMLLMNADMVFGLNLFALCAGNPVRVVFASYTVLPAIDLYYDGELTWWERWRFAIICGIVGVIAGAIACIFSGPCGGAATAVTVGTTIGKIVLSTAIGVAIGFAMSGLEAGMKSAATGNGFWNGFAQYIQKDAINELALSFAIAAVTVAIGNAVQHFQCFKEGTLVETEEGLKPIEDIQVGDKVLAYDEETGEQAYKPVVRLFRNTTEEWYHIHVNGEEIICTGGHPFYVASLDKFIPARELKVGNSLLLSGGTCVIIEEIQVEKLSRPQTTYNFEVEDYHTYYVSDSKILVHNMCKVDGGAGDELDWEWYTDGESRIDHVMKHAKPDDAKSIHSVFNGNPIEITNEAWGKTVGMSPTLNRGADVYVVPFENAGTAGENAVQIVVKKGTNKIITAYPVKK